VKFLVDNQLPGALARFCQSVGHVSRHVLDLHMEERSDAEIWEFAKTEHSIVVSKDEDFVHLANRLGDDGRLLWVRIGNCRKEYLLQRFRESFDDAVALFEQGSRIVEIR
jgi:predicted nuclease of predicted toxin-antitoxin system